MTFTRPNLDGMVSADYNLLLEALDNLIDDLENRIERLLDADYDYDSPRVQTLRGKILSAEIMVSRVGNDAEDRH